METTKEQKLELRKKWVEALRSGKYEQGQGYLCYSNRYCCLGVACDVVAKELPGLIKVKADGQNLVFGGKYGSLPREVRDAMGIAHEYGRYVSESGENGHLTADNDSGFKFYRIANLIESSPEGLFID